MGKDAAALGDPPSQGPMIGGGWPVVSAGFATMQGEASATIKRPCRAVLRRHLRRDHAEGRVLAAARTCWELQHGAQTGPHQMVVGDFADAEDSVYLRGKVADFGLPPVDAIPRGSFAEIQGSEDYAGSRCDLAGLDVAKFSLPQVGFVSQKLEALMGDRHPDFIKDVCATVLPKAIGEEKVKEIGLVRPYSDPALRSRSVKLGLVKCLLARGLTELSTSDGVRVGIFCVWKSDGVKMRLIVDARISNCHFSEPTNPDLPTGASYARLRVKRGEVLNASGLDHKDAFYTMELPAELLPYFTLDPICASDLGIRELNGVKLRHSDKIFPRFKVIPMEWSHAVWVCQAVVKSCCERAVSISRDYFISDSKPVPCLKQGAIVVYVDNVVCLSISASRSAEMLHNIDTEFRKAGLLTHDVQVNPDRMETLGWEFDRAKKSVRPKGARIWRLWLAISHALERQILSGTQLSRLVGHFVSMALIRREALSAVHACYSFIHQYPDTAHPLCPSVVRELRWIQSLLPMLTHSLYRPSSSRVLVCDASGWGKGVIHGSVDVGLVDQCMSYVDRWRYKYNDDSICSARLCALEAALGGGISWDGDGIDVQGAISRSFVPDVQYSDNVLTGERSLFGVAWRPLHSMSWQRSEHIIALESRCLVWCLRHISRPAKSRGHRFLICADSMVNILALSKGRTSAPGLVRPCRQFAGVALLRDVAAVVRWIPSEGNPSDGASRGRGGIPSWEAQEVDLRRGWAKEHVKSVAKYTASEERRLERRDCEILPAPPCEGAEGGEEETVIPNSRQGCAAEGPLVARRKVGAEAGPSLLRDGLGETQEVPLGIPVERVVERAHGRDISEGNKGFLLRGRVVRQGLGVARGSWVEGGEVGASRAPPPAPGVPSTAWLHAVGAYPLEDPDTNVLGLWSGLGGREAGKAQPRRRDPPGLPPLPPAGGVVGSPLAARVPVCRQASWRAAGRDPHLKAAGGTGPDQGLQGGRLRQHRPRRQAVPQPGRLDQRAGREVGGEGPSVLLERCRGFAKSPIEFVKVVEVAISSGQRGSLPLVAIEVFSGTGSLARALRTLGFLVLEVDVKHGQCGDVLCPAVKRALFKLLQLNVVSAVHVGVPYSSFSGARNRVNGPKFSRSIDEIRGAPNLSILDQKKVDVGNALASFSAHFARTCLYKKIPFTLENPYSSLLWKFPDVYRLLLDDRMKFDFTDFCMDGKLWRKRTGILSYLVDISSICSKCCSSSGSCMRTHRQHQQLIGTTPKGVFLTLIAESYPSKLCRKWALAFKNALMSRIVDNWTYYALKVA